MQTKETGYVFPLYLFPEKDELQVIDEIAVRKPNLNQEIVTEIENCLGRAIEPIELFDYIYAVLHSPSYRETYKEFLKIDFPRVPYPDDNTFKKLVELGRRLRKLHLMEDVKIDKGLASYPEDGKNNVTKIQFSDNKVYINEAQYFDNVPIEAWEFYIGGYQPAQKWLKDRKGRALNFEDILHYQKIIHVLKSTGEVMQEIDQVGAV